MGLAGPVVVIADGVSNVPGLPGHRHGIVREAARMRGKLITVAILTFLASMWVPRASTMATPQLSWRSCGERAQCATLAVPVDWRDQGTGQTTVALQKLPATRPTGRTLLVNLGGPGPSIGTDDGRLDQLRQWFDVVLFDPRGFGRSAGITCPPLPDAFGVLISDDSATWREFRSANRGWYQNGCVRRSGGLAAHVDAWQVAHDMEAIRRALGVLRLDYFGNSYGTVYGQSYADLFPVRVGRMFLDSLADHTEPWLARSARPQAVAAEQYFDRFARWCQTMPDCALHGQDVASVWQTLLATAARRPLPAGSGRSVAPERLRAITLLEVTFPQLWPALASALQNAQRGDAGGLYQPPRGGPSGVSTLARCADFPLPGGQTGLLATEQVLRHDAPRLGWLAARRDRAPCAGLPATNPPRPIRTVGQPPILVVNGTRDSGTVPAHGQSFVAQLPGSRWLGADTGHAVYLGGNQCVRRYANHYLRTGLLPPPDTICPATTPNQ